MPHIKTIFMALLILLVCACKKPTEDIKVVVDMDVIKYSALLHVTDASNPGATINKPVVKITGADADNIYEISGKKKFKLVDGILTIGPGPDAVPTTASPVSCVVEISAPGYVTAKQTVTFTEDEMQQVISIVLTKPGEPIKEPEPPAPQIHEPVTLNFLGTCTSKPDMQIRPSVYIFTRETGSDKPFAYLGYLDKGSITTKAVDIGKTYDFQINYGGENYVVSQEILQDNYNLTLDMGNACNNF